MELWGWGLIVTLSANFGLVILGLRKLGTGCFSGSELIGGLILLVASTISSIYSIKKR